MKPKRLFLEADKVEETIERLSRRIEERFPNAGLVDVNATLLEASRRTKRTVRRIRSPIYLVRLMSFAVIASFFGVLALIVSQLRFQVNLSAWEFIQTADAGINSLIFLAVACFFLASLEVRIKRKRVIKALNRLRDIAHVIDMMQLTKDPDAKSLAAYATDGSPKRILTPFELWRYLDYCSEMLSLTSKLGYLYIADFSDPIATRTANELETLATSLSRKIWQKIMILRMSEGGLSENEMG